MFLTGSPFHKPLPALATQRSPTLLQRCPYPTVRTAHSDRAGPVPNTPFHTHYLRLCLLSVAPPPPLADHFLPVGKLPQLPYFTPFGATSDNSHRRLSLCLSRSRSTARARHSSLDLPLCHSVTGSLPLHHPVTVRIPPR
jgi:hypothetical protein